MTLIAAESLVPRLMDSSLDTIFGHSARTVRLVRNPVLAAYP